MVEQGSVGTSAFDYYDAGKQTGKMAIRILNGEKPENTPVEFVTETKIYLNKTFADKIGLDIPQSIIDKASEIY